MGFILSLCGFVLVCWAVRLARVQVLLLKQRQVIRDTHAALALWQQELEAGNASMLKHHAHGLLLIEQSQIAQEKALMALGRSLARAVGEMDEDCGRQVLNITARHVSQLTTARVLATVQRKAAGSTT